MIRITGKGDYAGTRKALQRLLRPDLYSELERYGQMGVQVLAASTPVETGLTANSWTFRVFTGKKPGVIWYNTNMAGGTSIAVLIRYGHGTRTGGYVIGNDFVSPVIRPLFDKIEAEIWKKVQSWLVA